MKNRNAVGKMSSNADLEGVLLQQQSCGEFIHVTVQESRTYTVFIDEDIIEPKHYRELLSLLFNASENDHINFMINSGGGNLSTALAKCVDQVISDVRNLNSKLKSRQYQILSSNLYKNIDSNSNFTSNSHN